MSGRLLSLITAIVLFAPLATAETLKINKVEGEKEELIFSLLKLALEKVDPNVQIEQLDEVIPEGRWASGVEDGSLDLLWAGSSKDLDERMLPVRIPLLKGLLGHRVFLIRREDQPKYDAVSNLDDLKSLHAGMGSLWGSTRVLEAAGLPVVKAVKYPSLFYMLDGGRFDYFPRAVHEPWAEIASHPTLNLKVEEKLLLIYPYAMYLYVRKDNRALHHKLNQGLELAIADGSFDLLFFNNTLIKDALNRTNLANRLILRIPNPEMHPDTPVHRPELWLNVNKL